MGKRIFIFIIIFTLIFTCLKAQEIWAKIYQPYYYPDGENMYFIGDIRVCPDEGYLINGKYNYYDFPAEDHWRFFLKTDVDGNLEWDITIPEGSVEGFIVLDDGSFIIAGENIFNYCQYLQKRDSSGTIEWTVEHDFDYKFNAVELTNDGNIIITGGSMDSTMNLQKFELNGNLIWRKTYLPNGFEWASGNSVVQTDDNGYAITGNVHSSNSTDILIMKTNEVGDSIWTKTFDEQAGYAKGNCIIENSYGNLFVTGYFNNDCGGVLIKFNNDGEILFYLTEQNSMRDYAFVSMVDSSTEIIGYGRGNLYSYTYEGDSLWVSSLIGYTGRGDRCLQKLDSGYICVGTVKINYDDSIVLTKTDEFGNYVSISNDELPEMDKLELLCFPNPFNPTTTISFSIPKESHAELSIYNIKGQKVKTLLNESAVIGKHTVSWNGKDEYGNSLSSGIYFYKLKSGVYTTTKKMILLK
ncbi:MAG: T9SS type A sorting domain-containing protein [Bacteroidales bacterium]|nr:T9SS type A sorting domain-containing protein [Bacteroidales bacterium]